MLKEGTRKRLSKLILEELSDKIKDNEGLGHKLEAFADLPVEKVADAILKQFEYLLTSDLRELIIHLIEQEVAADKSSEMVELHSKEEPPSSVSVQSDKEKTAVESAQLETTIPREQGAESIMEYFAGKEPFPTEEIQIELKPEDWFYLIGFSYAPDSSGKGNPSVQLQSKGIGQGSNIFLFDYGDVRFYMSKLNVSEYARTKLGEPTLTSKQAARYKYDHELILNNLRMQEVLVPLQFWTIIKGREKIIKFIEDRYVELLRSLIDVHDAIEWDVDALIFDDHIARLPSIVEASKGRGTQRETRHSIVPGFDVKLLEKVIFREKNIAQEVHSQLLVQATKAKIDYMIRLDSAFMDDWKSILSARYTLGKEKRKSFCQTVAQLQEEYKEYQLMLRVTSPSVRFTFAST